MRPRGLFKKTLVPVVVTLDAMSHGYLSAHVCRLCWCVYVPGGK